jgi:hypothetical protein
MQSIKVRQRVGSDGILHLEIPTEVKDGDVEVIVVYQPVQKPEKRQWSSDFLSTFGAWKGDLVRAPQEVNERGWPVGFFEQTYGICADDPIVVDDGGIAEALDDDMEGVFDKP